MDLTAFYEIDVPEVIVEPKHQGELNESDLENILLWYGKHKTSRDADTYVLEYLKEMFSEDVIIDYTRKHTNRFGFLCRIVMNGSILPIEESISFDKMLFDVRNTYKPKRTEKKRDKANTDIIKEKALSVIYSFEDALDDYVTNGFQRMDMFSYLMPTDSIKGIHAKHIIEYLKENRGELERVLTTNDEDLKEAYSHFTKLQISKLIKCYDSTIIKCEDIIGNSKKVRKIRKRKKKSSEQMVSKVKVCREFKDLGLTSIDPSLIIGAQQVWVYDVKYKKLGLYFAKDSAGFTVKGTTILEFDESKSIQKILRKPQEVLTEVKNGGKSIIIKVLGELKTREQKLTGRLNENVVLLRSI